jgi:amino acid transporter
MSQKEMATTSADADAQRLAEMCGYKQEFKRSFSKLEVFGIAFSIMGVLPSIASTLLYSLPSGGPIAMVWGWLVTCFFIALSGLALGDLASSMPTSGGLYFWTYTMAPKRCRRLLCWLVGYANTLSTTSAVASIDWGLALQIMAAVTIATDGVFQPENWHLYLCYAAILLTHAILTSFGTTLLARMQTFATVLGGGLSIAIIIALCAATPDEYRNDAKFALGGWYNDSGWNNVAAFMLSMLMAAWTVASYDSAVHISEEASNAATAVPLGIIAAIVSSALLGVGILISITFNMGTDLDSIINSDVGQPLATIFLNSFGKKGCLAVWTFIIITQYFMGASMSLASSRQVFAFSRDGALPFSGWIYRINKISGTPVNSAWFSTGISALLGLLGLINAAAVGAIFSLSVIGASIAYGIPVIARLCAPKEQFKPGPWYLGDFWSPVVGWSSTLYLVFISVIVCIPSGLPVEADDMNYASLVTGAVFIFSLAWYYCPKYGGVHWFTGPRSNLEEEVLDSDSSQNEGSLSDSKKQDESQVLETYELPQ